MPELFQKPIMRFLNNIFKPSCGFNHLLSPGYYCATDTLYFVTV